MCATHAVFTKHIVTDRSLRLHLLATASATMYVAAFRFLGFSEPESNRLANERLGHVRFSSYTIAASSNYLEIGYFYFCYFLQWQKKDNLSVYVRPVLLTPMQQYLHGLFPDLRGQREQAIPSIRDLVDGVNRLCDFMRSILCDSIHTNFVALMECPIRISHPYVVMCLPRTVHPRVDVNSPIDPFVSATVMHFVIYMYIKL